MSLTGLCGEQHPCTSSREYMQSIIRKENGDLSAGLKTTENKALCEKL